MLISKRIFRLNARYSRTFSLSYFFLLTVIIISRDISCSKRDVEAAVNPSSNYFLKRLRMGIIVYRQNRRSEMIYVWWHYILHLDVYYMFRLAFFPKFFYKQHKSLKGVVKMAKKLLTFLPCKLLYCFDWHT